MFTKRLQRDDYEKAFLTLARAVTVGVAYVSAAPIPGLISSFVAIFASLLPFDTMVASTKPPVRWRDWKRFLLVLWPRIVSTAVTLLKGVAVGTVVGILAVFGLPRIIGAVLTSGLAYVWAVGTRHNISSFVGLLSGLALFERLVTLDVIEPVRIIQEIVRTVVLAGGGTLLGLLAGWGVGFVAGSVARLFLSRPYRSLRSAAYDPPMERRPFNELLAVGERSLVASATIEEGAPVAHRTLAASNLRDEWHTTVLSVKRGDEEFVMPEGSFVLVPGDKLLLLTDKDRARLVHEQFNKPASGSVESA